MLTNQSREKKKYEPLEQALAGQSELVKSRVYSLIVHWGIEPENEFFVIFIAMGQLVALVEEAPRRFDSSFEDFTDGINQWTKTNIQILNEIADKAKLTERLAGGTEKLAESSAQLVQVCSELIVQLKQSNGTHRNFQSPSPTSEDNYEIVVKTQTLLKAIDQKLLTIEALISNPQQPQTQIKDELKVNLPKKGKLIWNVNLLCLGLLLLSSTSGILNWRSINQIDQRTNWLLEKANRQECLQGIKSVESIECTTLPSR